MAKVKMPKKPKKEMPIFNDDDITRLLAAGDNLRDRAIVMFLLDTGVRVSELVNLNAGDVDMSSGAVLVRMGKGQKDRTTYASARAVKQLLRYLSSRGELQADAPLWVSERSGERLTKSGAMQFVRKLGKRAGVTPCTAHMFRRYWAVRSLKNGMDVFHLQRLGGWESFEAMRSYIVLAKVDLEAAHRQYGVVDSIFRI